MSAVGRNYRYYFDNNNVFNWKLSVTQDELCELRFLKEIINVRDRYQMCNVYIVKMKWKHSLSFYVQINCFNYVLCYRGLYVCYHL